MSASISKRPVSAPQPFFPTRRPSRRCPPKRVQRGAAALALMMLLGLAIGLMVISYSRNVRGNDVVDQRTIRALAKAREALLGYAATYRDFHPNEVFAYLPCPDMGTGTEGEAASACGSIDHTVIGRLPWKTLDLPPLRDSNGECLWYAVSGNYKNNPKTFDMLNQDSNGLIEIVAADGTTFIAGTSPTTRAAAVIFAPGAILPGQDRTLAITNTPVICGGNYTPGNYLDTDVTSSIDNSAPSASAFALSRFIAANHSDLTPAANDAFNDQMMAILPTEIFDRHLFRRTDFEAYLTDPLTGLLRRAADCLVRYGRTNNSGVNYKFLPWPARFSLNFYGQSNKYIDWPDTLGGRLPGTAYNSASSYTYQNFNYNSNPTEPLLRDAMCNGWNDVDEFWEEWKDHLFYAVSRAHRPDTTAAYDIDPCSITECIDVEDPDGVKTDMAAVVIFSGTRQTGQSRNNVDGLTYLSTDKADPANYLEGDNLTGIQASPSSSSSPNRRFSKLDGNDSIMCLRSQVTGFNSELIVDPTCGATARCTTDGDLLAAYRSGASNTCKLGSSGIDATCQTIAGRIEINNCPGNGATYSCKRAARDFLSFECLQGFAGAKCQLAHTTLTNCE